MSLPQPCGANQVVVAGHGELERRGEDPLEVREYRLGGHQVLTKWPSYRESKVLQRGMSVSEVARRVSEILWTAGFNIRRYR